MRAHDALLLDLDGVLYLGGERVAHAETAVASARARGVGTAFVTNNASRSPDAVARHLCELGIPASAADVVTSGQAAARVAAERVPPDSTVLVVGSPALAAHVREAGLRPVTVRELAGRVPAAVVQGLAADTTWRDLAEAAVAVRAGAVWIAGNADATLPTPRGPVPGNGALVEAVRRATGLTPLVAGKPEPAVHEESLRRTGARRPLVVGDRLDTDVAGAVRVGCPSLLVLTGVTDLLALLQAPPGRRPDFVGRDLRVLEAPQPAVVTRSGRATCDGAVATFDHGVLTLVAGTAPGVDPDNQVRRDVALLRAACARAWAAADRGEAIRSVDLSAVGRSLGS